MQYNLPWRHEMALHQLIPNMSVEHEQILWEHRIRTPGQLLFRLSNFDQRQAYSILLKIEQSVLLNYANAADFRRITGLGYRYINLLRSVNCVSLRELSYRNAEKLHKEMYEANLKSKLVLILPSLTFVRRWITRAKQLPKVITYR